MFLRISNVPRDYAWGAPGAISELLGLAPSDAPEAELWLGAHPGSPSHIVDSGLVGGADDLAQWIAADHVTALGDNGIPRLPYLLKVLAAGAPLSLQVHPDAAQAAEGFAREQAAGIPIDAPERNYRDDSDKPELLLAVSDTFEALCGFRSAAELRVTIERLIEFDARGRTPVPEPVEGASRASVPERVEGASGVSVPEPVEGAARASVPEPVEGASRVSVPERVEGASRDARGVASTGSATGDGSATGGGSATEGASNAGALLDDWLARVRGDESLGEVFAWLLSGQAHDLVEAVVGIAREHPEHFALVVTLADAYPGDPGAVIALMLNHLVLRRGEALHLPARVIHSYLRGVGIELMASSDNVLRGGLTPKHVDVPELLAVLDARPGAVPLLEPVALGEEVRAFRPEGAGFQLVEATGPGMLGPVGPAIALCTEGSFAIIGGASTATLGRGDAVYITPDEGALTLRGEGTLYVATVS